ncbi:hypothetical protein [Virgibacillus indicus]|nr:hypothetical protein [Virgibacillus indicus]
MESGCDERIDRITEYRNEIWDVHYEIKEKETDEAREYIQQKTIIK